MMTGARFVKFIMSIALVTLTCAMTLPASPASAATIQQMSPTSGTTDVAGSGSFFDQLEVSGSTGSLAYTVTTASAPSGLTVSPSGVVSTSSQLAATTYTISGTDSDTSGDSGTWLYSLVVTTTIVQGGGISGTVDVAGSANFNQQLASAAGYPGPLTYTVTTASAPSGLTVSPSGVVSTSSQLAATTYTISGTDSDTSGDSGTWSYSLVVTPDTIIQSAPTSGSVAVNNSATFTDLLNANPGFTDTVSYTITTPSSPTGLVVTSSGVVSTSGQLAATTYTISGTDSDTLGDSGTWTYTLNVFPVGSNKVITQTSPTSNTTTAASSGSFAPEPIIVENNTGTVTFVTTSPSTGLVVTSEGVVSTTGPLAVGTYTVSGTDSDSAGDTGAWTYTLVVGGTFETVSFDANGGSGVMAPESESEPAALSVNTFTWPGHTFVKWNSSANGTGVSYANGAVFQFTSSITLFAQWKSGKAPSHSIRFVANGGTGLMPSETDNTPTAISANRFVRNGYTFINWNTAANGSGRIFRAGTTYSFRASITLYARWKKVSAPSRIVTFFANGGTGAMSPEQEHGPTALSANRFLRVGFTFTNWNTRANGSGNTYVNGATYSFSTSISLYAQWKKEKKVIPPVKPSGPLVGPFVAGSAILTGGLESEVSSLASQIKTDGDEAVSLLGYGDALSAAQLKNATDVTANAALGRMRAQAVATDLAHLLSSLGFKGWTISISGASASASAGSSVDAALVLASLS